MEIKAFIQDNWWHKIRLKLDYFEFHQLLIYPHKCKFIKEFGDDYMFDIIFSNYYFKVIPLDENNFKFVLENKFFNKIYNGKHHGVISKDEFYLFKDLVKKNS